MVYINMGVIARCIDSPLSICIISRRVIAYVHIYSQGCKLVNELIRRRVRRIQLLCAQEAAHSKVEVAIADILAALLE